MSLKKFSELFINLDSCNSKNKKIEILKNYFYSNHPLENAWTIYLLTGKNNRRFVSGLSLKALFSEIYEYPLWLIDSCYLKVGDSAEVISLLLRNKIVEKKNKFQDISLHELLSKSFPNLSILKEDEKKLRSRRSALRYKEIFHVQLSRTRFW